MNFHLNAFTEEINAIDTDLNTKLDNRFAEMKQILHALPIYKGKPLSVQSHFKVLRFLHQVEFFNRFGLCGTAFSVAEYFCLVLQKTKRCGLQFPRWVIVPFLSQFTAKATAHNSLPQRDLALIYRLDNVSHDLISKQEYISIKPGARLSYKLNWASLVPIGMSKFGSALNAYGHSC